MMVKINTNLNLTPYAPNAVCKNTKEYSPSIGKLSLALVSLGAFGALANAFQDTPSLTFGIRPPIVFKPMESVTSAPLCVNKPGSFYDFVKDGTFASPEPIVVPKTAADLASQQVSKKTDEKDPTDHLSDASDLVEKCAYKSDIIPNAIGCGLWKDGKLVTGNFTATEFGETQSWEYIDGKFLGYKYTLTLPDGIYEPRKDMPPLLPPIQETFSFSNIMSWNSIRVSNLRAYIQYQNDLNNFDRQFVKVSNFSSQTNFIDPQTPLVNKCALHLNGLSCGIWQGHSFIEGTHHSTTKSNTTYTIKVLAGAFTNIGTMVLPSRTTYSGTFYTNNFLSKIFGIIDNKLINGQYTEYAADGKISNQFNCVNGVYYNLDGSWPIGWRIKQFLPTSKDLELTFALLDNKLPTISKIVRYFLPEGLVPENPRRYFHQY